MKTQLFFKEVLKKSLPLFILCVFHLPTMAQTPGCSVNLGNDTTIACNKSILLNAGSGIAYHWNTGATTQLLLVSTTGTYTVSVTNQLGCTATDSIHVTVNPSPTVNLGNDTTVCYGQTVVLDAGNPGLHYTWNTGATTQTITAVATGTYSVTVYDSMQCHGSDAIHVTVRSKINVNLGFDTTIPCNTTLTLNAGNSGLTYTWSTGATTQTIIVLATGTYSVTVSDQWGCSASDSIHVTVNPPPTVNLGNDTTLCYGQSLMLDADNSNMPVLYNWSTGSIFQTITVSTTGTYWVTVRDAWQCQGSDTIHVIILPKVKVDLGRDTSICAGQSVPLNAGNPGFNFTWNTGATTQTITVTATGTFSVTVTNSTGCTGKDAIHVTVNPTPTVNIGNDTTVCFGKSVVLNAYNFGSKYKWSTGATTQTITATSTGTYAVTVTNQSGCSATDSVHVTVLPKINVDLGKDTIICKGLSLVLNAHNSGSQFTWSTGATTQTVTVAATGTYSVTVTNSSGCLATDAIQVTVNPLPAISLGNDTTVCFGKSVVLNAHNAGAKFKWSTGATTQTITAVSSGTYSVIVTNQYGCSATDSIHVTVNPLLTVNLGKDTVICKGESIILNAQNPGLHFIWSTGATTQTVTVATTGTYSVTVTNPSGCSATDAIHVTVNPSPTVNLGNDTTVCLGQSVVLNAHNAGAKFTWNTGATTQTITAVTTGTYSVTVTNQYGCSDADTIHVKVNSSLPINLGDDTTICFGQSLVLNAHNPGSKYIWNMGATTQTITIDSTGTYSVTVTNPYGCTGVDTINVIVLPKIIVNLGSDTTVCFGQSVLLNAYNPGLHYTWSTGATTQTITADTTGSYFVTVTNPYGCTGMDTIKVTVRPEIVVNLGNDTTIVCHASLTLNANNTGMMYIWSTGATTQTITTDSTGTYFVVVTNQYGCKGYDTIHITALPAPTVNLGNDTILCYGDTVILDAGNTGFQFLWSTGATTQNITVAASGTYTVTAYTNAQCSGTDSIHVTVLPKIMVDLGKDTLLITCSHQTIPLDAGNPGSHYMWSTGATTQTITVSATGTYFVTVTSPYGCTATDLIDVTIINNSININLGKDTIACGCIQLTPGYVPGATYLWCSGQNYPTINVCKSGTYCVELRTGNCIAKDTIDVTINPSPTVDLGNDTTVLSSIVLNAENPGAAYAWNTGATTQMITVIAAGQYYVAVTDPLGCNASDTINVDIILGIPENGANGFALNVYPNPSNEKTFTMSFEAPEKGNVEIRIVNILGRVVYSEKLENFKGTYNKTISLQELSGGIYFADVLRGNNRSVIKIILD